MNSIIVYQSSTGNTRFGVQIIQHVFEHAGNACEIVHVKEADPKALEAYDCIGIASAVYAFQPAHNMQSFLRELPDLHGKAGFVFCSFCALPARTLRSMAQRLAAHGVRVLGGHGMPSEDSWPVIRIGPLIPRRGRPNEADADAVQRFARRVLERYDEFAEGRLAQDVPVPKGSLFWHLVSIPLTRSLLRMMGKYVRKSRCTKCGKCVDICPTGSIRMEEYPVFADTCMGCFACVNMCPESAITCPMSWGRPLYHGMPDEKARSILARCATGG